MSEKVILRQNLNFETEILAADPDQTGSDELQHIHAVHELSPYTMLLVSLAACTAIVVNTYAGNHKIGLEQVELRLSFDRVFNEDCVNCLEIEKYSDQITEEIRFTGDLSEADRQKLFRVAHACPIQKMLETGVPVESRLSEAAS